MRPEREPLEPPRTWGCLLSLVWLLLLLFAWLLFAAAYSAWSHGQVRDEQELRSLAWWLAAAGAAATTIVCCLVIISMRLRRLNNRKLMDDNDHGDTDGTGP